MGIIVDHHQVAMNTDFIGINSPLGGKASMNHLAQEMFQNYNWMWLPFFLDMFHRKLPVSHSDQLIPQYRIYAVSVAISSTGVIIPTSISWGPYVDGPLALTTLLQNIIESLFAKITLSANYYSSEQVVKKSPVDSTHCDLGGALYCS